MSIYNKRKVTLWHKVKCFFGSHEFWRANNPFSITRNSNQTYVSLRCCINCGKFKASVGDLYVWDDYERWQELAGVDDDTKAPEPDPRLTELKNMVDSGRSLDLSKMDIDVESYKNGEEIAKKRLKSYGYALKEDKDEGSTGS